MGDVRAPADINPESLHARVTVYNPPHPPRRVSPLVIRTDAATRRDLAPGGTLHGSTNLFWGSHGFAFETPGRHMVNVRIVWWDEGVRYVVGAATDVWVDYPTTQVDNDVAASLMHREVGMIVALGGGTPHLEEGMSRIREASSQHPEHPACAHMTSLPGCCSDEPARGKRKARVDGVRTPN
jgi:hypothetical protein